MHACQQGIAKNIRVDQMACNKSQAKEKHKNIFCNVEHTTFGCVHMSRVRRLDPKAFATIKSRLKKPMMPPQQIGLQLMP